MFHRPFFQASEGFVGRFTERLRPAPSAGPEIGGEPVWQPCARFLQRLQQLRRHGSGKKAVGFGRAVPTTQPDISNFVFHLRHQTI